MLSSGSDNYGGTGHSYEQLCELSEHGRAGEVDRLIVEQLAQVRQTVELLKKRQQELEGFLMQLYSERHATVIAGSGLQAVLKLSSPSWQYDTEVLSKLQAFLPPDEYEQAVQSVPATVKVDKNRLNKLAKRGGSIQEIIEAASVRIPGSPQIVLVPA